MEVFTATYNNSVKFSRKQNGDFCLVSAHYPIFVLADSSDQDGFSSDESAFPLRTRTATQAFCYNILNFLEDSLPKSAREQRVAAPNFLELVKASFNTANKRIKGINKKELRCQYHNWAEHDWLDTVGVTGFLIGGALYYGCLGNCGLAVFDKTNTLRFQTEDGFKTVATKIRKLYPDWRNFNKKQQVEVLRRDLRNSPSGDGYGSFTGEKNAEKYYQIDYLIPESADLIIFYSKGFKPYLGLKDFVSTLREGDRKVIDAYTYQKARENYREFGNGRALIAFRYEES